MRLPCLPCPLKFSHPSGESWIVHAVVNRVAKELQAFRFIPSQAPSIFIEIVGLFPILLERRKSGTIFAQRFRGEPYNDIAEER